LNIHLGSVTILISISAAYRTLLRTEYGQVSLATRVFQGKEQGTVIRTDQRIPLLIVKVLNTIPNWHSFRVTSWGARTLSITSLLGSGPGFWSWPALSN